MAWNEIGALEWNSIVYTVQELNGCISVEYEWNDSTLDLQFQSPGHKP